MRKIICYIATSIDGKIADSKGGIEWLDDFTNPEKEQYGYQDFFDSIDTTIMGNSTYQKIQSLDVEFPYAGKRNFVITKSSESDNDAHVTFLHEDIIEQIKVLKEEENEQNIWLVGGGKVNALLEDHRLIDELRLFIIPVVLGTGIPLFQPIGTKTTFDLISSKQYKSGIIELRYIRK
ncbi:dihydrofolate reductase family protein [Flammeovirga kamogawensis]|uniref:Dihydrofolate reductase family protein n=1 Tax=Flammeovirga kamogawensis TaxID=373891 RepID=A0ABX8GXY8_9BACT|nr:dihydrofolate reductase family protein [Flammeovirga kamogawensis]MBB6460925.1 dihydrofolate reductase [Flammeovirga kamogawensis]QWG08268.1 dihydrofolate reductase family protein [Flammeovirga kamogawensis]TRX70070.1 dihydrofolate reductase [Flammeovirga kamogawensis]